MLLASHGGRSSSAAATCFFISTPLLIIGVATHSPTDCFVLKNRSIPVSTVSSHLFCLIVPTLFLCPPGFFPSLLFRAVLFFFVVLTLFILLLFKHLFYSHLLLKKNYNTLSLFISLFFFFILCFALSQTVQLAGSKQKK